MVTILILMDLYSFRDAAPVLGFTGLGTLPIAGNFSAGIAVTDAVGGTGVLAFDFNPQVQELQLWQL